MSDTVLTVDEPFKARAITDEQVNAAVEAACPIEAPGAEYRLLGIAGDEPGTP